MAETTAEKSPRIPLGPPPYLLIQLPVLWLAAPRDLGHPRGPPLGFSTAEFDAATFPVLPSTSLTKAGSVLAYFRENRMVHVLAVERKRKNG